MNQLLTHDPNEDPRKRFFHHESVSILIEAPSQPGFVNQYSIPFGPPVIHLEPEKTLAVAQQQQRQFNEHTNGFFFNISGPSIVPEGYDFGDVTDENVEMEE